LCTFNRVAICFSWGNYLPNDGKKLASIAIASFAAWFWLLSMPMLTSGIEAFAQIESPYNEAA
jgi:hypothetical protein